MDSTDTYTVEGADEIESDSARVVEVVVEDEAEDASEVAGVDEGVDEIAVVAEGAGKVVGAV